MLAFTQKICLGFLIVFYQSKQENAPTEGGSGIGLALSKELAQFFHGDLSVESELGKGTTFYFSFPKKEVVATFEEEVVEETPVDKPMLEKEKVATTSIPVTTTTKEKGPYFGCGRQSQFTPIPASDSRGKIPLKHSRKWQSCTRSFKNKSPIASSSFPM